MDSIKILERVLATVLIFTLIANCAMVVINTNAWNIFLLIINIGLLAEHIPVFKK